MTWPDHTLVPVAGRLLVMLARQVQSAGFDSLQGMHEQQLTCAGSPSVLPAVFSQALACMPECLTLLAVCLPFDSW